MDKPILGVAPMAGLTDQTMRALCYRMGANYACTEMVSAIGWMHAKDNNPVYRLLLAVAPEETNTAVQIFGKDPVLMREAAARATELRRFQSIDINMGCPVRKVVSTGEGSGLMKTPELAVRIMEAVKAATDLPVTVKMRLGFDAQNLTALELARPRRRFRFAGCASTGVRARRCSPGRPTGKRSPPSGNRCRFPCSTMAISIRRKPRLPRFRKPAAAGFSIGRGAMGNPWLFRRYPSRAGWA